MYSEGISPEIAKASETINKDKMIEDAIKFIESGVVNKMSINVDFDPNAEIVAKEIKPGVWGKYAGDKLIEVSVTES